MCQTDALTLKGVRKKGRSPAFGSVVFKIEILMKSNTSKSNKPMTNYNERLDKVLESVYIVSSRYSSLVVDRFDPYSFNGVSKPSKPSPP